MLKNHLLIAFRSLQRRGGYTAINVAGLAVAFACCLLIGLYVEDELSYDQFHEDADALVAVGKDAFWGRNLTTPYPLGPALEEAPGVKRAVRTGYARPTSVATTPDKEGHELRALPADPTFFETFSFPLQRGDAATALAAPDGAVLTASTARTLFGDADPVDRQIYVEQRDTTLMLTVTGVAADVPDASTIQFDLAIPMTAISEEYRREDSWGASMYQTYARLDAPVDTAAFNAQLRAVLADRLPESYDASSFFAIPLPSIYLSDLHTADGFRGQTRYLYIFGSIALFVLLIAAINYINLVTALGTQRAKEVGVRKTLGAGRGRLALQFLGESALLSLFALALAFGLTVLALPVFNGLFEKSLSLDAAHGPAILALSAFVLGVGVLAGLYPAVVLSSFRPVEALRGRGARGPGGTGLRRGLVVVQFAVTVVLLVATGIVYQQLDFLQNRDLGFDGEQVVVLDLPVREAERLAEPVRQAALNHPAVLDATVADAVPGRFRVRLGLKPDEFSPDAASKEETIMVSPAKVDAAFVPTLGLHILAGRSFDDAREADRTRAHILTRSTAEVLGWNLEEAVGKPFRISGGEDAPFGEVIGVVENFHIGSLHDAVAPIVLVMEAEGFSSSSGVVAARLAPDQIRAGVAHLEAVVERFAPGMTPEYAFLDDTFDAMYRSEERLGQLFGLFAGLAVFVACLGLFGLAAFTAERRTKEVGIRKVLGASVTHLVLLLSREFAALVLVALVVAAPLAYLATDRWLDDFAYRVEVGPGVFLLASLVALGIALLAVSGHALRAATSDPVDALRYE